MRSAKEPLIPKASRSICKASIAVNLNLDSRASLCGYVSHRVFVSASSQSANRIGRLNKVRSRDSLQQRHHRAKISAREG